MEDKQAKKLIKRAKKHPDWYTAEDVRFAKMVKKRIKQKKKHKGRQQNVVIQHNMIGKTSGIPLKFRPLYITDFEKVWKEMDPINP